jgi:hypothetical protein
VTPSDSRLAQDLIIGSSLMAANRKVPLRALSHDVRGNKPTKDMFEI